MGMILGLGVDKGSDLPENGPRRKFKGRAAFQWNQIYNRKLEVVMLQ